MPRPEQWDAWAIKAPSWQVTAMTYVLLVWIVIKILFTEPAFLVLLVVFGGLLLWSPKP